MVAEFDLERTKRILEHEEELRFEALDNLVQRISDLEEAYSKLPQRARTPQVKRAMVCRCLQHIDTAFSASRQRRAKQLGEQTAQVPRFTTELLMAFRQLKQQPWKDTRPPLFSKSRHEATPKNNVPLSRRSMGCGNLCQHG